MNQYEDVLRSKIRWLLTAATVGVYWRVSHFGFINYDDGLFVAYNPHVYSGVSLANVKWAFTTLNGGASTYHPLTWLTHQLDCQLFGLQPGLQHLTNLSFHLANTVILFTLLDKLTGKVCRSAVVAALFALHPLHIETVAWISERKSLVCLFFWLLTTLAYIEYVRKPCKRRYLLVLGLFTAALLSKPIAVSLPITLLLLDYWPLSRIRAETSGLILAEKIPFFVLSGMGCYMAIIAQLALGATSSLREVPIQARLNNAVVACVLYLKNMALPMDLAPIYPLRQDWAWWQVCFCGLILLSISVWTVSHLGKRPHLLVGWSWYLITLFPTLGIVQVGKQGMADRYTYVPLIGMLLLVIWEGAERLGGMPNSSLLRRIVAAGVAVGYAISTCVILPTWQSSISLFEHALLVTRNNYIAHSQLGQELLATGNAAGAEGHFRESLRIRPRQPNMEIWLGECLFREGDCRGAFEHYSQALNSPTLKLLPDSARLHDRLAELFFRSEDAHFRDPHRALEEERRACELTNYKEPKLLENLAKISAENGLFKEALVAVQKAREACVAPDETGIVTELISEIRRKEEARK